jgi:outer membrane immunogenic protein
MKKLMLAAIAAAVSLGGSANAAEMAVPVPVYRPPPLVTYFTWSGCYVGGNVGGLWARTDWTDQIPADPFFGRDFGGQRVNGGLGGAQVGCNYQIGGWVFGMQGDYDWSQATGSSVNTAFPFLSDQSNIRALSSLTGRVGYAWDRFLLYGKGGGAWVRSDYNILNPLVNGFPVAVAAETRGGWTLGIGGEYAFLDWLTGFVEYDFYGFGTNTSTFICPPTLCNFATTSAPINITMNINVLKVGLNFKFGPTAPLLARY